MGLGYRKHIESVRCDATGGRLRQFRLSSQPLLRAKLSECCNNGGGHQDHERPLHYPGHRGGRGAVLGLRLRDGEREGVQGSHMYVRHSPMSRLLPLFRKLVHLPDGEILTSQPLYPLCSPNPRTPSGAAARVTILHCFAHSPLISAP
jgi:hypothetical protein